MDEKIEEMISDIKEIQPFFYGNIAEMFIEKGYRKESDTAREILDEAKKWVKAHYKDKVTDSFGEREMLFMEAFGCLFGYLKEKYEVK